MSSPERVLSFWFGALKSDEQLPTAETMRAWFQKSDAFDERVRKEFGVDIERASSGEREDWAKTPRGRLALLILIDQMRRNIYRGKAEAFAGDARALRYAQGGIELGHDRAVRPVERAFFYFPLEHAEDRDVQEQCVLLFEALDREAPAALRELTTSFLDYAIRHRDIVRRFGRFPHRNAILGRASTLEEIAFLKTPGSSF